jgi:hypothetical protein
MFLGVTPASPLALFNDPRESRDFREFGVFDVPADIEMRDESE